LNRGLLLLEVGDGVNNCFKIKVFQVSVRKVV